MLARFRLVCAVLATGAALAGLHAGAAPASAPPTLHLADQTSGSETFTNSLTVTLLVTDAPASVQHIFNLIDSPAPGAADLDWSTTLPETFPLTEDGPQTVYWWVKDGLDAITKLDWHLIIVDRGDPQADLDIIPAVTTTLTVGITAGGFDNAIDPEDIRYILKTDPTEPPENDSGWDAKPEAFNLPPGDGAKTLYLWTRDLAGNVSAVSSDTTVLDTQPPTATLAPLAPITRSRTIAIAVGGADLGGITHYLVSESTTTPLLGDPRWLPTPPTTFAITSAGDGTKTLRAWTKDVAGHVSAPATRAMTLDSTLPSAAIVAPTITNTTAITATISGADTAGTGVVAYYSNTDGVTPATNAAGWSTVQSQRVTLTAADGVKPVYGWTKDAAGNVSSRAFTTARLDRTAPATSLAGPSRTRSRVIAIVMTAADAGSGVAGYYVSTSGATPGAGTAPWSTTAPKSFTLPAGDGAHALYAWTKDAAGNVSARATLTVTLDTAAPDAVIASPLNGAKLATLAAIKGTAVDATTGVAAVWIALRWRAGATCSWWDGSRFVKRSCATRLFVRARGRGVWRLRLPNIAGAGRYTAYVYAVDLVGNRQNGLVAGKNLVSFTITNRGATPADR